MRETLFQVALTCFAVSWLVLSFIIGGMWLAHKERPQSRILQQAVNEMHAIAEQCWEADEEEVIDD